MRKTMTKQLVNGCVMLATLIGTTSQVDAGTMVRRAARAQRMEASEEAAAALTAVGAAQGWGRIKVEDSSRRGVAKREVEVDLFDMEPMAVFQVEADGVFLGTITTDASGWGSLELETDDDGHPPVPAALPPAGDLVSASVRDTSDAFILDGSFVSFAPDKDDDMTVHEEKISLSDQAGTGAAGVAKVEREADDQQEFDSRATGLIPGASYSIAVDGFMAGVVTADRIGQARLKLESPDDENPLPTDLQPVEGLRVVEWLDGDGNVVLAGIFTGVSNDDDDDDNGGDGSDDDGDDDGNHDGDDNGGHGGDDDDGDDDGDDNGGHGGDDDDDDEDDDDGDDDDDDDDDDYGNNSGPGGGN